MIIGVVRPLIWLLLTIQFVWAPSALSGESVADATCTPVSVEIGFYNNPGSGEELLESTTKALKCSTAIEVKTARNVRHAVPVLSPEKGEPVVRFTTINTDLGGTLRVLLEAKNIIRLEYSGWRVERWEENIVYVPSREEPTIYVAPSISKTSLETALDYSTKKTHSILLGSDNNMEFMSARINVVD